MASSQRHSQAFLVLTLDLSCAEQVGASVTAEQGATCARSYYKCNELCKDKRFGKTRPKTWWLCLS